MVLMLKLASLLTVLRRETAKAYQATKNSHHILKFELREKKKKNRKRA